MGWSFRKRVKIIPGVHLNVSKSGISTTIGVRGANVNISKKGTYLNTGIPGTGISSRKKIGGGFKNKSKPVNQEPINEPIDNINSVDVDDITSQNMEGVKQTIMLAHQQRLQLRKDIIKVKSELAKSKAKLIFSYIFIFGFFKKGMVAEIKSDIQSQRRVINDLAEEVKKSYVGLDVDFSEDMEAEYKSLVKSFESLTQSSKIWDVTGAYNEDTRKTRSAASTVIKKNETKIGFKQLPDIKSKYQAMYFKNLNGADVYIYPNFIIMYEKNGKFGVIDFSELDFKVMRTRFIETEVVPKDSKIIDKTWAKVNKNGTPDKRFKGNYQIPVVAYGDILMKTQTGMNENWQFSNCDSCIDFGEKFLRYKGIIESLVHS